MPRRLVPRWLVPRWLIPRWLISRWLILCGLTPRGLTPFGLAPGRPIAPAWWAVAWRSEKLKVVSLGLEARVVPAHDHLQNTLPTPAGVLRQLRHALGEFLVSIRKVRQDCFSIARSAGNVVRRVVRVDDRKPVVVLVRKPLYLVLEPRLRLTCGCVIGAVVKNTRTFGM